MKRTALLIAAGLCLAACSEAPVTDAEADAFVEVARAEVPGADGYADDVLAAIALRVCRALEPAGATADDARAELGNYKSLTPQEQSRVVRLAAGSACPEDEGKVGAG